MPRTLRTKPDTPEPLACSREELARIFGVGQQYISKLHGRGMPRLKRGRYSIPDCVQWYLNSTREQGLDPDGAPDVVQARTELYQAQVAAKRLETEILAGRQIDAADVRELLLELGALINHTLEGRAIAVAPELAQLNSVAEIQTRLLAEHRDMRRVLADELQARANA